MTAYNLMIGAPSSKRLSNVTATKYTVAPRTNEFKATVNGVESSAWTTEGRGSQYLYFRDGEQLFYVKVAGPDELTAARQSLVVTSDAFEEAQTKAPPRPVTKRRRVAKSAA